MKLLEGYVALDLTDLRGQFCGKVLRDLGMEVVKVEPPDGDPVRHLEPFAHDRPDPDGSLRFAYLNAGTLFVKRFEYQPGKDYPDRGCNFETFTNEEILEAESLGPLARLEPGQAVEHVERWELFTNVQDFRDEAGIDANVRSRLGANENTPRPLGG